MSAMSRTPTTVDANVLSDRKLLPVVMSGGSGTRLWPVSRSKFPKQFCDLLNQPLHTLTLNRLKNFKPAIIVTSENFQDLTESDIRINQFLIEKVLYEPMAKNTAPAIALLCRYLELHQKTNEIVGVFSSDNLILDQKAFLHAIDVATKSAIENNIVTLGILPSRPETGFGYIQVQDRAVGIDVATSVLKFHEKPNLAKAQDFIAAGTYFWNAGIFIFKVSRMIELFKKFEPAMWAEVSKIDESLSQLKDVYSKLKNISIDYAILEKLNSDELKCVTCDIGWSDLGSWDALTEIRENFNKEIRPISIEVESKNNSIVPIDSKTYSFVGVNDLIVVDTKDALLICKKGESQKVKSVVEHLKISNTKLTEEHVFENRPWGRFEVLKDDQSFKSKIIQVDAGQKISYQSHAQRAEHWILIEGQAVVILNDQEIKIQAGEHIFIPQGAKHRIINKTEKPVRFIEVQVGSYFGEDDIVRYQDDYGRKK